MQKWEYCVLNFSGVENPGSRITYYSGRPHPQENVKTNDVDAKIAELGMQGWELVSVAYGRTADYYFKRPLP